MKSIFILMATAIMISGCTTVVPVPKAQTVPSKTEAVFVEEDTTARNIYKEIGIIEELNASGCDIKKFETSESARKNTISVSCK